MHSSIEREEGDTIIASVKEAHAKGEGVMEVRSSLMTSKANPLGLEFLGQCLMNSARTTM